MFGKYWFDGEAELNRYELQQARYGELHEGEAVLIFVTEDFLSDDQVKYEQGPRDQVVPVLKLNYTRKFFTGLYPYSMMSSIFTPVGNNNKTIKVSTSVQEWCGHVFSQLNLRKQKYEMHLFSYFQQEGDQHEFIDGAMLEDEIWNKIRINPAALPIGEITLIPSTQYARLKHTPLRPEMAIASINEIVDSTFSDQTLQQYKIEYIHLGRTLSIIFEPSFPYAIIGWEETYQSGFNDPQLLVTKAKRTNSLKTAYWKLNSVEDSHWRSELGLDQNNK